MFGGESGDSFCKSLIKMYLTSNYELVIRDIKLRGSKLALEINPFWTKKGNLKDFRKEYYMDISSVTEDMTIDIWMDADNLFKKMFGWG